MTLKSLEFYGKHIQGIGKAHQVAKSSARTNFLRSLFGCPLIGTFNILTSEPTDKIPPTIVQDIHRFNFIKISLPDGTYRYGWGYRFDGSRQKGNILEVYTKNPLPPEFKEQPLTINFYPKWTQEEISAWQKDKYWFQGFDWLPSQRANSKLLWNFMQKENYAKKSVLDFGTHYGYFAFQASKKGAVVDAIDKDPNNIAIAKIINEHIEQQDILFITSNSLPETEYDIIFELSVYHWIEEEYTYLPQHLEELKKRCKILFLELINPPLRGRLSQDDVDEMVGREKIHHYQHRVRRTRTLYKLNGYL